MEMLQRATAGPVQWLFPDLEPPFGHHVWCLPESLQWCELKLFLSMRLQLCNFEMPNVPPPRCVIQRRLIARNLQQMHPCV